jgi:hypothetical protein
MEPVSLTLGAIVVALIARAQERALDATLSEGESVLRRLRDSVSARFSRQGDQDALDALELVERVPDSDRAASALAQAIDRHAADGEFRSELDKLIGEARASGVIVKQFSQAASGDGNVQIADISGGSTIKVDR